MNEDIMKIITMLQNFNDDLMNLNIKYSEEIEELKAEIKVLKEKYENNSTSK